MGVVTSADPSHKNRLVGRTRQSGLAQHRLTRLSRHTEKEAHKIGGKYISKKKKLSWNTDRKGNLSAFHEIIICVIWIR